MTPVSRDAPDDPYRIGVIGVGSWAAKFEDVADGDISFHHAADVLPYDDAGLRETLDSLDIPAGNYVDISDRDIPDDFYDGVDVVQVASPIRYHEEQTLDALDRSDAVVITEKAPGPTRDAIDPVRAVAADHDHASYPHLHYIRKLPSMRLAEALPAATDMYGPVEHVTGTFIEERDPVDADRDWVFDPANGGIMLDWIHPIEVLVWATGADLAVRGAEGYITEPAYSTEHPTAAAVDLAVDGEQYDDAAGTVRVGKGFPAGSTTKAMRFDLEDATLDVRYAGSGTERTSDHRGQLRLLPHTDRGFQPVDISLPRGPMPYEIMADDMGTAVETGEVPVTWDQLDAMMETVDAVNARIQDDPVREDDAVDALLEDALDEARDTPSREGRR